VAFFFFFFFGPLVAGLSLAVSSSAKSLSDLPVPEFAVSDDDFFLV
jgi:hypothetical protein